jgi:acetyl-CoA acetyltransferase
VGAVPVGRYPSTLEHELFVQAFLAAVTEARVDRSMIDALAVCSPRPYCDQGYFSTFMAGFLGLTLTELLVEILGNGMTGGLAFDTAVETVRSGRARVAVAVGVSRETQVRSDTHMETTMRSVGDIDFHSPLGVTPISWYALNATAYMHNYAVTRRELAAVAVKNRSHAAINPLAQYRNPISTDDVLAARAVSEPLHLLDVSPRSDGAAAVVVTDDATARRLGHDVLVEVRGRGFAHEGVHQVPSTPRPVDQLFAPETAAAAAYGEAGIDPGDLSFAEIYAPTSIVEVLATESLGLIARGDGAKAAVAGTTSLGGRIPVCTSGGCLSRGHPPMVTPLYNVVEAVTQLRHAAGARQVPDARLGAVTAELGDYNGAIVHVLGRTS